MIHIVSYVRRYMSNQRARNLRGQRPPRWFTITPWLRPEDKPVSASSEARGGLLVPWIVLRFGSLLSRLKHWGLIKNDLQGSLKEALESARSIRNNPRVPRDLMTADEQKDLIGFLAELGISSWSSTAVRPEILFRRAQILYPQALVVTLEMEKTAIETAPSPEAYQEIFRTYHQLGQSVNRLAEWFRNRGFGAHAGPAVGGDVNYVALAQDAGLGTIGRNGLLIGDLAGPRMRLAAVYTSVQNLPKPDLPDTGWVQEFCGTCGACIKSCPAKAIYEQPVAPDNGNAGHPVYLDYTRCALPFSRQFGCSLCIKVCPFSHRGWEKVKEIWNKRKEKNHA